MTRESMQENKISIITCSSICRIAPDAVSVPSFTKTASPVGSYSAISLQMELFFGFFAVLVVLFCCDR